MTKKDTLPRLLLDAIEHACGQIFTTEEATIVGESRGISHTHTGKLLTQMVKENLIARIEQGLYADRVLAPDAEAIANIVTNKDQILTDKMKGENKALSFLEMCTASHAAQTPQEAINALLAMTQRRIVTLETLFQNAAPALQNYLGVILFDVSVGGNIIVCGPAGSGRTTALHALAAKIPNHKSVAIIEDSPELHIEKFHPKATSYSLPRGSLALANVSKATKEFNYSKREIDGVTHEAINLNMMSELTRVVLRSHPDVLIVGDTRDQTMLTDCLDAYRKRHMQIMTSIDSTFKTLHAEAFRSIRAGSAQVGSSRNWLITLAARHSDTGTVRFVESVEPWHL